MRASSIMLGLLVAATPVLADGTFCWDEMPGVATYRLYSTEVVTGVPPSWSVCDIQSFTAVDICSGGTCCTFVVDRPGDLVYYFVTYDGSDNGGHAPIVPCP